MAGVATRRRRYLERRVRRLAKRSPAPAVVRAEAPEVRARAELQEARRQLGRATSLVTRWQDRVARLERALERRVD